MSDDEVQVEFVLRRRSSLQDENLDDTYETFGGWPKVRQFTDALIDALTAMPRAPKEENLIPKPRRGSFALSVEQVDGTGSLIEAERYLRAGPDDSWTAEMYRRTQEFRRFIEKNDYVLQSGPVGNVVDFPMPTIPTLHPLVELGTLSGRIHQSGGAEGTIRVIFDSDTIGTVTCKAGKGLAKTAGEHLYERALFRVEIYRDPFTMERTRPPKIVNIDPLGPDLLNPRDALMKYLDGDTRNVDLSEFQKVIGEDE